MAKTKSYEGIFTSLVRFFIQHYNAANLLMLLMIGFGIFGLTQLNRQFFPNVQYDFISVGIIWPGASPEDVDTNIIEPVQNDLRFIDNIEDFSTTAREGIGYFVMQFRRGTNMSQALSDVEQALDQVTILPKDIERPIISQTAHFDEVGKVLITGDFPEAFLRSYAKNVRDGLLQAGIQKINIKGLRDPEIWIEINQEQLERYGLTHLNLANAIQNSALDTPGGLLRGTIERQVRAKGLTKQVNEIGKIEVLALPSGQRILVRDVAHLSERFNVNQPSYSSKGNPALTLTILRATNADSIESFRILTNYIDKIQPSLPEGLQVALYDQRAKAIDQRIHVLTSNGRNGIILVLLCLFLFLNARVAFWVAMGIPISIMATLGVLWLIGETINMISLFGFIMTLGIVVDDAIVVGEHSATVFERGEKPSYAAERGVLRMAKPVLAAGLTTIAAFFPILLIDNIFGDFVRVIPIVVGAVLVGSLIECFFILPAHMKYALKNSKPLTKGVRKSFLIWFEGFRLGRFRQWVEVAYHHRTTTLSVALAALIISLGLFAGNRLAFRFFPDPESEALLARIIYHPGTPRAQTLEGLNMVQAALYEADRKLAPKGESLINVVVSSLGTSGAGGGDAGDASAAAGAGASSSVSNNRALLEVELTQSEDRDIRTETIKQEWVKNITELPGLRRVVIEGQSSFGGADIDFRLEGDSVQNLKAAAEELKDHLVQYPNVRSPRDNLYYGKKELLLEVKPQGAALGFTNQIIGDEVRNGLEGKIARRFARDDDEVTIRVLLPRDDMRPKRLEDLSLLVPNRSARSFNQSSQTSRANQARPANQANQANQVGQASPNQSSQTSQTSQSSQTSRANQARPRYVPLPQLVHIKEQAGFSSIKRSGGKREVRVAADYDKQAGNPDDVIAAVERDFLPSLLAKYDLQYRLEGKTKESGETVGKMRIGMLVAMVSIYLILALAFGSYLRPLVIMTIIPFGLVGAFIGHLVHGLDVSFLSLIALFGLSGILVNGSIILITRIEERIAEGEKVKQAVVSSVVDRLRPVLLTSFTTVLGLTPLLFETSIQAQFLMPMVVTMAWGLGLSSLLVLFLCPALFGIQEDIKAYIKARYKQTPFSNVSKSEG